MNRVAFGLALLMALLPGCFSDNPQREKQSTPKNAIIPPPKEPQKPRSPVSSFTNADIQNWCIAAYQGLPKAMVNLNEKIEFYERRLEAAKETGNKQAVTDVLQLKEIALAPAADLVELASLWDGGAVGFGLLSIWVRARDEKGIVALWLVLYATKMTQEKDAKYIINELKKQRPKTQDIVDKLEKKRQENRDLSDEKKLQTIQKKVNKFEETLRKFRETWPAVYASQLPPKE